MSRRTIVREFGSEAEAAVAAATLRANGIDADLRPSGYAVGMTGAFGGPTAVVADVFDVDRARELLNTSADIDPDSAPDSESDG